MNFREELRLQMERERQASEIFEDPEPERLEESLGYEGFWYEFNHRECYFLCLIYRNGDDIGAQIEEQQGISSLEPYEVERVLQYALDLWNASHPEPEIEWETDDA